MLVFLVAGVERHGEALRHELEAREDGHPVDHAADGFALWHGLYAGGKAHLVVVFPCGGERIEVGGQLVRHELQIGAAAIIVALADNIIRIRTVSGAVRVTGRATAGTRWHASRW